MNFFEQQERARKHSGRLILLLILAVVCLVGSTSLGLGLIWYLFIEPNMRLTSPLHIYQGDLVLLLALGVTSIILLGMLYKSSQLREGGRVVAERLGGRLINLQASTPEEQRLLNVVEEMAIASGMPVPPVYVLEDESINAFAAGLTAKDAVIGITQGAICQLKRSELQGVIAHEFSHIQYGDMRLNVRLIALLHGILLVGLTGRVLLRILGNSGRRRSSNKNGGAALLAVAAGGALLCVLGYIGTFFGQMIKASVNRQREFLADASAVQFTRDPGGIAGALKKIGSNPLGALLSAPPAAEFSHLYFGDGVGRSWFDSHPPLSQRIQRIEPSWDGQFPAFEPLANQDDPDPQPQPAPQQDKFLGVAVLAAISSIGAPGVEHLQQANNSLQQLDEHLLRAAHSPQIAQALVYGLLLDKDAEQRNAQLEQLKSRLDIALALQVDLLSESLKDLQAGLHLPLLSLATPALKELDAEQLAKLQENILLLIRADGRMKVHEWALVCVLERSLRPTNLQIGNLAITQLAEDAATLLGVLAHAGGNELEASQQAFADAWSSLPFTERPLPAPGNLRDLDQALKRLEQLRPLQKPQLLKAMVRCIEKDGQINLNEAELLRAVASALDCPMPPLLTLANQG